MKIKLLFVVILVSLTDEVLSSHKKPLRSNRTKSKHHKNNNLRHVTSLDMSGTLNIGFGPESAMQDPHRSMVCSPLSALLPLGKLALGAEGSSQAQLLFAIGVTSKSQIKKKFKTVIKELQYLPDVTLNIASRLYVSKTSDIKSSFQKQANEIFGSSVEKVDFNSPATAAKTINSWVEKQTSFKIPRIVDARDISQSSSMIIVNAIYFKAKWKFPFEKTYADKFYTPTGQQNVIFMSTDENYRYGSSTALDSRLIEIPYYGEQVSFIIVLPNTKDGLTILLHKLKLAPDLLTEAIQNMSERLISLTIPKFKIETELNLRGIYQHIGVTKIFDLYEANLNKIIRKTKIFVSGAVQKAIIEVAELGTEAAAATGISFMPTADFEDILEFKANRPFVYYIIAKGKQLFMGTYTGQ